MPVILARGPFLDFLTGATLEGYADVGGPLDEHLPSRVRLSYETLLTEILVNGRAIVEVPPYLLEGIDCQKLLGEELVEFGDRASADRLHERIYHLYRYAFDHLRAAESNPRLWPLVPLEGVDLDGESSIDFEMHISEATWCMSQLQSIVAPFLRQFSNEMQSLFENDFNASLQVLQNENESVVSSGTLLPEFSPDLPDFTESSLFDDLGLRLITAYEQEHGQYLSYYPNDLENIDNLEMLLTGPKDSIETLFEIQMAVRMRPDPLLFLKIHAYWSVFMNLYAAVERSSSLGAPVASYSKAAGPGADVIGNHGRPCDDSVLDSDRLAIFRAVLLERGAVPEVHSIEDVLRLRDDIRFQSLQERISEWQRAIKDGELECLGDLRRDIASKARRAATGRGVASAARTMTWIGAPVAAYDALRGTLYGMPAAFVAPFLDAYLARVAKRHSWIAIGL